jgi:putative tryptophan/tyrosine transport system substrate-binding protein
MRRREFIAGLGSAVAWPLTARAQRVAPSVIGLLSGNSSDSLTPYLPAFRRGLSEVGFKEGDNIAFEYCWADDRYDQLPALAADLVRRQVAVIVAVSTPAALAAKAATASIPIVFFIGGDPVKFGLVASFNRPGANVTGARDIINDLGPKNLELLHHIVPSAAVIAMLVNPTNQNAEPDAKLVEDAARVLGVRLLVLKASDRSGIDGAFAALSQERIGALLVGSDSFFPTASDHIVALAARHRMPALYDRREFAAAGGLMSYGPNVFDSIRQVGVYAGRVLKGERPGDLPVVQSTKFELVINLNTAKALGLTIPETLLATADEVIQ